MNQKALDTISDQIKDLNDQIKKSKEIHTLIMMNIIDEEKLTDFVIDEADQIQQCFDLQHVLIFNLYKKIQNLRK